MPPLPPLRRFAVLLFLAPVFGCGPEPAPVWLDLVQVPAETVRGGGGEDTDRNLVHDREGTWLEFEVRRAGWRKSNVLDCWLANSPFRGVTVPGDGEVHVVEEMDGRRFRGRSEQIARNGLEAAGDWSFALSGTIVLCLEGSEVTGEGPSDCRVRLLASRTGEDAQEHARVPGTRFSGRGIDVFPGFRREMSVEVPPGSALRFATSAERMRLHPSDEEDRVRFRVTLDGATIFAHEQTVGGKGSVEWHAIPLPPDGVSEAKLAFEVGGLPAFTSFLAPGIGPAEIGEYGRRPWGDERESVVVFLADTFRADNLAAYGGDPAVTPNLNAFAEQSLCFEKAWSTGTTTLLAHISMFTGLYPPESGVDDIDLALPTAFDTIAERLGRFGYRTGAVTDAVMVSRVYGLDQGFEYFDEIRQGMDSTRERTRDFLAADDGRPVFLFVHSYRAHTPYVVEEETKRRLEEALGIEFPETWEQLSARRERLSRAELEGPAGREISMRLQSLYRGASADLDRGFGELLALLDEHGLVDRGTILVTSDHGEAFEEHGPDDYQHAGHVWEEQVRVPLLIHGARFAPGRNPFPVSLVDLSPTLAEIARVPADDTWRGSSILARDATHPLFAFECTRRGGEAPTIAILDGDRKLIVYEDVASSRIDPRPPLGAFDLRRDPGETEDLFPEGESWPAELWRRLGPTAESHLVPLLAPHAAVLDAARLAELEALGYGGVER